MVDQEKIHNQCFSDDPKERMLALDQLKYFSSMPDKQKAWNDLHRLTNDKDRDVRSNAVEALGSAFSQVPDKQQAWNDLHRLTIDEDIFVITLAAMALGSAFSQVPDKQSAWNDLHRLTTEEGSFLSSIIRSEAAYALGSAFSQVPDKQSAWNDLHRLTTDENRKVRSHAQYSLGRVSIFKASQAETEKDYKKELENAIDFFKKAAQESSEIGSNLVKFCLPFYRSFYTIIFKKQEAKEGVNKYLEEAKAAIKGSKNKELLFEAVENLAKALEEVQNLGSLDLQGKKCELDSYRKYCENATELMRDVEEATPFAAKTFMKGLPILEKNLKEIIEEILETSKQACQKLQGTPDAELACKLYKNWNKLIIDNQEEMAQSIEEIISTLKGPTALNPNARYYLDRLDSIQNESDLTKIMLILKDVTSHLLTQLEDNNFAIMNESGLKNKFIDSFVTKASFLGFICLVVLNIMHSIDRTDNIICLLIIAAFFIYAFAKYNR